MEAQQSAATVVSGARRNVKVIAQTDNVRIVEYTLNAGERHPWHRHSEVSDRIYCLEGLIGVGLLEPAREFRLKPGETCEVPVGTVHHVSNAGDATGRYLLVQALGKYDYIRAD
ncbi:MAG TPA: cupin domain-containing protein [Stellaceae bacterium]|jgi:quercetin dioxygenase-like cupin family protein